MNIRNPPPPTSDDFASHSGGLDSSQYWRDPGFPWEILVLHSAAGTLKTAVVSKRFWGGVVPCLTSPCAHLDGRSSSRLGLASLALDPLSLGSPLPAQACLTVGDVSSCSRLAEREEARLKSSV